MRRYYTYDDDEYLAHSKGPWRNHKYIQKIVQGGKTIYKYASDAGSRAAQGLGSGVYGAGVRARNAYGAARRRARAAADSVRGAAGSAYRRARAAADSAYRRHRYESSARRYQKKMTDRAAAAARLKTGTYGARKVYNTARAYGYLGQAKLRSAKYKVRKAANNAYNNARTAAGNARKWAHDQAGRARNTWNNSRVGRALRTPYNNFMTGYNRARDQYRDKLRKNSRKRVIRKKGGQSR